MLRFRGSFLLLLLALGIWGGPAGHAQSPVGPDSSIQRGRLDLRAADWSDRAKTTADLRIDDAVRLRAGARTGRVVSAPIELPFAVNGIGPHWDAMVPPEAAVEVELRVRAPSSDWGRWTPVAHEVTIPETIEGTQKRLPYSGDHSGGLLLTEAGTRVVQVRLTLRRGEAAGPVLRRLSLYLVDATGGPPPPSVRSRHPDPDTAKPDLYMRSEWGAQSPTADYRYAPATHLAIHHTATASAGAADTWEECAAGVRAIQDFHINGRGWIDIGYNYLICQTGAVFQGREDGNDARDVVAAHDGFNEGSAGTAGLGFFHPPENQRPSDALLDGFVDLFAWIATRREIDPEGVDRYAGYGRLLRTVYGHRDVKATACPGDHLYPKRAAMVERLVALVPDRPDATTLSANAPNPATSVTRFEVTLATPAAVRLAVYDLLGRRVATRRYGPFSPGTHTVSVRTATWAAGPYPYRLTVGDETNTGTIQVVR